MSTALQAPALAQAAILEACQACRCELGDLLGASHEPRLVRGRRRVAIRLRAAGWSLPRIGLVLGRHHTTILHLLRTQGV